MLAHELAHIRRHDLAWGWLAALAECLFFFHPLVRLGNREWELAQEIACDELVVHITDASQADYGTMLTTAAAYSVETCPTHPAGGRCLRIVSDITDGG